MRSQGDAVSQVDRAGRVSKFMSIWGAKLLDAGFGHPTGLPGRVGGWLMARGNAATEQHLVGAAELRSSDVVLVLGHGPGVGMHAAGLQAGQVIGIDPSTTMRNSARRRCWALIAQGRVHLQAGVADDTGLPDAAVDVALAVNNVHLWPDWSAGFTELRRVLRPGGRLLISAHQKWLPGGQQALITAARRAGFADATAWTWEPPSRRAATAIQLRACCPSSPGQSPPT